MHFNFKTAFSLIIMVCHSFLLVGLRDKSSCRNAGVVQKQFQGVDCNASSTGNPDVFPKIKWGDLDDRTLLLHQEKAVGSEMKFDRTESQLPDCTEFQNADNFMPCPSSSDQKENNLTAVDVNEDHRVLASNSSLHRTKSLENNCKEVNEVKVTSEDVKAHIISEKVVDPNGSIPDSGEYLGHKRANSLNTCSQTIDNLSSVMIDMHLTSAVGCEAGCSEVTEPPVGDGGLKMLVSLPDSTPPTECGSGKITTECLSGEKNSCLHTEEAFNVPALAVTHKAGCSKVSESSSIGTHLNVVSPDDSQTPPSDNIQPEASAESIVVTPFGNSECQPVDAVLDDLQKTQIMDRIDKNGDESKERFRERLWCFLFENLNRAIDELYLLCELECDWEQMKEAILVLEEAASDFRDLNSRVEEFEKVKKSSSHIVDGAPLTMKSDHRRPHALSWEVSTLVCLLFVFPCHLTI